MSGPSSATLDRASAHAFQDGVLVEAVAPGRAAQERLRRLITTLKGSSALAPVTVIVGSTLTGIALRRALVRAGEPLAGVRFLTLTDLASTHAAVEGPALGPAIRDELVRLAIGSDPDGPLGQVARAEATHAAAVASFGRLRRASAVDDGVLDELARVGGLTADVVRAFRHYRGRAARYVDVDDRVLALAAGLRSGEVSPAPIGPVVLYLPDDLAPAEAELVGALAEATPVHALVGLTGDPTVDGRTRSRWPRLAESDRPVPTATPLPDVVIEAPDAAEEARAAVRRVLELLDAGAPADDIAVLHRSRLPYAALLRETFERAGVAIHGPSGDSLLRTAAGTTLLDLLAWSEAGCDRTAFLDWLHAAPVMVDGEPAPVRRWAALSAEANVTRHRRHWDRRLTALEERLRHEAAAGTERSERFLVLADHASHLRSYVLDLIDRLEVTTSRTWQGWADWATAVLDHTLGDLTAPDEVAARQVVADLAILDDVETDGTPTMVDRRTFTRALRSRLEAPSGTVGSLGRGIHVGPLDAAVDLGHRRVVLVGAVEGAFPATPIDDPLLPDRVVEQLSDGHALATSAARSDQADRELATVLAAADDTTVTWSRADRRQQRAQVPTPWLLAALGAKAGFDRPLRIDELADLDGPWYRRQASHQAALTTVWPVDAIEHRLATVLADERAGDPADHPALHVDEDTARGLGIERTRASEEFSTFDANVGPHPALDELLQRAQSPTALEAYGSCPRSFLFRRVLGIDAIEDTREPLTVSGRDRGSIIHEVLERYAQAIGDRPASLEERRHTMAALADEVLADAESRWPVGRSLLWQQEQAAIRQQLYVVVAVEDRLREQLGTDVTEPEVSVGDGPDDPDPTEVELPSGRRLTFKGRIDRLDRDVDGTSTVVASDYKTGSTRGFRGLSEDPVLKGTKLQAAIYALLAEHRHPNAEVHAQYWAVNAGTHPGNATVGSFSLTEQREAILAALDLISQGIADGVFPATPGDWNDFRGTYDACSYCPYDRICAAPGERERAWERDRRASATAPVRALQGATYLPVLTDGADA